MYLSRIKDRDADREGTEAFKKWRPKYQQDLIEKCDHVFLRPEGREEIRRMANEFILCTDNASRKLLELKEEPFSCHFVLSKSEPFNEEMVIAFNKLLHWLAFHGISQYHERARVREPITYLPTTTARTERARTIALVEQIKRLHLQKIGHARAA